MELVDLHCHVLPALDDGPGSMPEAIAMVHALEAEGVSTVVATPHLREDHPGVRPTELAGRCLELEGRAAAAGAAVAIEPGGELDLEWALEASPADLKRASVGGRGDALLIETPLRPLRLDFEERLAALVRAGHRVVLAHPEMSVDFQMQPDRLIRLVRAGILLQVTATALLRRDRRSRSTALARRLVTEALAHVLASDSHSAGPWRPPDLGRAVRETARSLGPRIEWMASDAPAALLAGEALPRPPRQQPVMLRGAGRRRRGAAA